VEIEAILLGACGVGFFGSAAFLLKMILDARRERRRKARRWHSYYQDPRRKSRSSNRY